MRFILLAATLLGLSAAPAVAADHVIVIGTMTFGPVPEDLHAGDTIVWQNDDIFRHTATARDGRFDVDLPAGASATTVVGEAGSVEFFCRFHPGMTGVLLIEP